MTGLDLPTHPDVDQPGHASGLAEQLPASDRKAGLRDLDRPAFLMSLPLSLSVDIANNALMHAMADNERRIDQRKAIAQFLDLYSFIAARAVVYLLPSTPGLQDQPYVANLAVVLPHLAQETLVVSRFRSPPRVGEASLGADFFRLFDFKTYLLPAADLGGLPLYFEGDADLKHIRGNLYVGAYGLRTSHSALRWFAAKFDMEVVEYPILDKRLYHLDCCLLVLSEQEIVLCRRKTHPEALAELERRCDIIDVSVENVRSGLTNSLIVGDHLLCDSPIDEIGRDHPWYSSEKRKIAKLERICAGRGLQLRIFNLSEFLKSGAALSCLVMRLNYRR